MICFRRNSSNSMVDEEPSPCLVPKSMQAARTTPWNAINDEEVCEWLQYSRICCPSLLIMISPDMSFLMSLDLPNGPKQGSKASGATIIDLFATSLET